MQPWLALLTSLMYLYSVPPVASRGGAAHAALCQGLTLVHLSAQREHFLRDTLGTFSRQMGHNSSQSGHDTAH
jgi:hypothetical protein